MCSAECQLPNWECCPGNGCIPRCLPRALHSQPPLNCLPHCSKKKGDSEHFLLRRASSWLEMQFVKNKSNHIKIVFLFLFFTQFTIPPGNNGLGKSLCAHFFIWIFCTLCWELPLFLKDLVTLWMTRIMFGVGPD